MGKGSITMAKVSLPRAVHKRSSGLSAIHGVLNSWQNYRSSAKASKSSHQYHHTSTGSLSHAILKLDGFAVDREEACVKYIHDQCETLAAEHRPTRLHIEFNPYSLCRGDERFPAGFISQWLADEDNGIRRNLESLIIEIKPAPSTSLGSEWITEAWIASLFPLLDVFGSQPHFLKEFKIHGSLFDPTSTRDVMVNQFGELVRNVLQQACSPSNTAVALHQQTPTWPLSSSSLTHISFKNIRLTPFVANQIAQGLRGQRGLVTASAIHAHLESLAFVQCHLDDEILDDLLSSLLDDYTRKLPRLQELLLDHNRFSSATFSTIFSNVLPLVPNLEVLDLSNNAHFFVSPMAKSTENDYGDDGSLSSHSDDSSIPADLADQRWEEQYVTDFAKTLQNHQKLHTISLRGMVPHYPSTTIPLLIAQFFSAKQSSLSLLKLEDFVLTKQSMQHNRSIHWLRYDSSRDKEVCNFGLVGKPRTTNIADSESLIASFLRGFSFIERVDALSMQWCCLTGSATAEELRKFLSSRQEGRFALKQFILCHCAVDETVGRQFAATNSLEKMHFEMCSLNSFVANAILGGRHEENSLESSKKNSSSALRELGFPINQIYTSSLPQLTLALKKHTKLEVLDLSRNEQLFASGHLSLSSMKAFFCALSEHSNLNKLRLCLRGSDMEGHSTMVVQFFFQYMSQNQILQELDLMNTLPFKVDKSVADNFAKMSGLRKVRFDRRLLNDESNTSLLAQAIAPYTSLLDCSFDDTTRMGFHHAKNCDPRIDRIIQRNRFLFRLRQDHARGSSSLMNNCELASLILQRLGSNPREGSAVFFYLRQADTLFESRTQR